MAQSSPPKRVYNDIFVYDPIPEGVDPKLVAEVKRRFELHAAGSKRLSRWLARTGRPLKSQIPPPIVPNVSVKSRKTIGNNKPDVRRKKLHYTEPEFVSQMNDTIDSEMGLITNESSTSFRNDKIPGGSEKPEKEKCKMISQRRGILSKFSRKERGQSSSTKHVRFAMDQSKPILSKNLEKTKESSSEKIQILKLNRVDVRLKRLRWLETHADDGMWIECCREECGKWRFVMEYDDIAKIPEKWYCNMNADHYFASCDIPEDEIPTKVSKQLIEYNYQPGGIVWAHLNGYPWWPAMIHNCPEQLQYCQLDESSGAPTNKYHALFFGQKNIQYAWLPDKDLKPYAKNSRETVVNRTIFRKTDFKKRLDIVCAMANRALKFSPSDRIKRFGLEARVAQNDSRNSRNWSESERRSFLALIKDRFSENPNDPGSSVIYDRELEKKTYKVGDIVWAHADKYPWWPAMIDVCSHSLTYFQFPESPRAPIEYHVVYFQEKILQWDWRGEKDLILFASNPKRESVAKKTKYGNIEYRRELDDACKLARVAQKLSLKDRLKRFSQMARLSPAASKKQMLGDTSRVSSQSSESESSSDLNYSSSHSDDSMEQDVIDHDKEIVSNFGQKANKAGSSFRPKLSNRKMAIDESTIDSYTSGSETQRNKYRFNRANSPAFSPIHEPNTDTLPRVASHRNELTSSNYSSTMSEPKIVSIVGQNANGAGPSSRPELSNRKMAIDGRFSQIARLSPVSKKKKLGDTPRVSSQSSESESSSDLNYSSSHSDDAMEQDVIDHDKEIVSNFGQKANKAGSSFRPKLSNRKMAIDESTIDSYTGGSKNQGNKYRFNRANSPVFSPIHEPNTDTLLRDASHRNEFTSSNYSSITSEPKIVSIYGQNAEEAGPSSRPELSNRKMAIDKRFSQTARLSPASKKKKLGDNPRVSSQSSESENSCDLNYSSSRLDDVMEQDVIDHDKEMVSNFGQKANEADSSFQPKLSNRKMAIDESTIDSYTGDSENQGNKYRFNRANSPVFSPIHEPNTDTLLRDASHRNEFTSSNYSSITSEPKIVSIVGQNANEAGPSFQPELSNSKMAIDEDTNDSSMSSSGNEGKSPPFRRFDLSSFPVFSPIYETDTDTLQPDASHRNELTGSNSPLSESEPDMEKFFRKNSTPSDNNQALESMKERQGVSSPIIISPIILVSKNSGYFSDDERFISSKEENHYDCPWTDDSSFFSDDPSQPDEFHINGTNSSVEPISSASDQEQREFSMSDSDSSDEDKAYLRAQRDYILAKLFD